MVHTLLLIFVLSVAFLARNRYINNKTEREVYVLLIFIMVGLRSPYHGTDTIGYTSTYLSACKQTFVDFCLNSYNEMGYTLSVKLLSHVLHFRQALLLVQGVVVAWSLNCFMKRFCKEDYFVAMLAFMSFGLLGFHLNGIRQSIAMSICLFAYIAYYDKKYCSGILITLLATCYHASAVVFFIVPVLEIFMKKYNTFKLAMCLVPLFCMFTPKLVAFASTFREKWENYEVEATGNGYIFFAIILIISILFELYAKSRKSKFSFHARIQNLTILFWAGRLITRTMERPAMYFYPGFCALLSNTFVCIPDIKTKKIVYSLFVLLSSIFFLYRSSSVNYVFFFMETRPF